MTDLVNLDAEREVLAGLLFFGRSAWLRVARILPSGRGFAPQHRPIFRVLASLAEQGEEATGPAMHERALALSEAAFASELDDRMSDIANYTGALPNLDFHARIVADLAARRAVIATASATAQQAANRTLALTEVVRGSVSAMVKSSTVAPSLSASNGLLDAMAHLERDSRLNGMLPGISSGLPRLDRMLDGWCPERLVVLAARPGGGKTAFGLWCAHTAASEDVETFFVTNEQPVKQLRIREIGLETNLDVRTLRSELAFAKHAAAVSAAAATIEKMPLTLVPDLDTVTAISLAVQQHNVEVAPVQLLIVDYLDYLKAEGEHERHDQALGEICRRLVKLAQQLNCCVLLLVQLRRGPEGDRKPKPPVMSDLANSAEVERAADQIILIWEPPSEDGMTHSPDMASIELVVAKNRHGPKGKVDVTWYTTVNRFEDAAKWYQRGAA